MAEVLAKTTFSSVIHNNEVCDEIVKWGNANGYPVTKAKLQNKFQHSYYRKFFAIFSEPYNHIIRDNFRMSRVIFAIFSEF